MSRIAMLSLVAGWVCGGVLQADDQDRADSAKLKRELFTGKVIPLRDALKKRGVTSFSEFDKQVVLETAEGELIPLVSDWRGRAFFQDDRLRKRKVELVGYRRPGVPYLQVLMVFTFDDKNVRQYTDYWCDICSIPMYEIKPCDCCQADIRLRFQPRDLPSYLDRLPENDKTPPNSKRISH
ncbi:MAG: hypothetical protein O3A00_21905 [Planctomycetota bacterium]|nr:hypothetical protein [Planctomycetota bacterium]